MSHRPRIEAKAAVSLTRRAATAVILGLIALPAQAAEPDFLERYAATRAFTLGRPAEIRFANDGRHVYFLRSAARSFVRDLYEFDARTGQSRVLLTAEQLLDGSSERLSPEELARRERQRSTARGIAAYDVSRDGRRLLVPLSDKLFVVERTENGDDISKNTRVLPGAAGGAIDARFSPDGKRVACVHDGELHVYDLEGSGELRKLTTDGGGAHTNGLAEFVAQEEMGRFAGYWWSPDSALLAYQHNDESAVEEWRIADPLEPAKPPHLFRYPRPGKANVDVRLGVVSADGGQTTWVEWDRKEFPYLASVVWNERAPLTILVQNRRQTLERLLAVDVATGRTRPLLEETDEAWLNIDQSVPRWLPDGKSFLWSSERTGHSRLEHRAADGTLLRELTTPASGYRKLLAVNDGQAYFAGSEDPRDEQIFSVSLGADASVKQLTSTPGWRQFDASDDGKLHLLGSAGLDGSRTIEIRTSAGDRLGELPSVAEDPGFLPALELTSVGESPVLHAAIVRPRHFDPQQKYPVIAYVYGGPTAQMAVAQPHRYYLHQWLADQGFVVVSLDGRGTPHRGREWERTIRGNFIEAPLADQAEGLKLLGEKHPELDLSRVGVYGWSFGGYLSAMAVERRPDLFRAGVAGAPVTDWLDYDTHYTERYLGLPEENPSAYEQSSVLSHAAGLKRPLLIIHGTADDNVYFSHSLKLTNTLLRQGIEHEFLPLAGQTHVVADPTITRRMFERVAAFFKRELAIEAESKDGVKNRVQ